MTEVKKNDLDFFDTFIMFWKNKWLFLSILIIIMILGSIYIRVISKVRDIGYKNSVNILIEDNPLYTKFEIVKKINSNLISSYNYENWSAENEELSKYLPQAQASVIKVEPELHKVGVNYNSEKTIEGFTSYLSFTAKITSDKISKQIQYDLKRKIALAEKAHQSEIQALENDIVNKTIEIKVSKEQLDFIENDLGNERKELPEVVLLMLNLKKTIKENEIKLQDLKTRKQKTNYSPEQADINRNLRKLNDDLLTFINTYISKDKITDPEIILSIKDAKTKMDNNEFFIGVDVLAELENELKKYQNLQLIRIGKTVTNNYNKAVYSLNKPVVYVVTFLIGFILASIIIFFREEYTKRQKIS